MEKEEWKNTILNSLQGAQRAKPDPQVYQRIQARLGERTGAGKMELVRRPYLALAAAGLALLITANVYALAQQRTASTSPSASSYQLDRANFDLY